MNVDVLGYFGTFILGITLLPQVVKTYSVKKADELSVSYLCLQAFANILFIFYGYFIKSLPVLICNSIVLVFTSSLLFAKYKFRTDYLEF